MSKPTDTEIQNLVSATIQHLAANHEDGRADQYVVQGLAILGMAKRNTAIKYVVAFECVTNMNNQVLEDIFVDYANDLGIAFSFEDTFTRDEYTLGPNAYDVHEPIIVNDVQLTVYTHDRAV